MQEETALNNTFLHRTDTLAARLGTNVQELPGFIGVSRRTLFLGRSANSEVTRKTWLKLESAERAAGIGAEGPVPTPERQAAISAASGALTRRLADAAEAEGGTEEQRQDRFEELMELEKSPLVSEILRLRYEVERLTGIIGKARELLE